MRKISFKVNPELDDKIALISNCYKSDLWLTEAIKDNVEYHIRLIKKLMENGQLKIDIDKKMSEQLTDDSKVSIWRI
jgi:hypothetical protein